MSHVVNKSRVMIRNVIAGQFQKSGKPVSETFHQPCVSLET